MQRFIFFFLLCLVTAMARRGTTTPPETPPRAYLPQAYPYGWGMVLPERLEVEKEKKVKPVKRGKCHRILCRWV